MIHTIHPIVARLVTMTLVLAALLPAAGATQALAPAASQAEMPSAAAQDLDFGRLPLYFVENRGQTDPRVAYYVLGGAHL